MGSRGGGPFFLLSCAPLLLDGSKRRTALLCVLVLFDVICNFIEPLEAECEQHQFVAL